MSVAPIRLLSVGGSLAVLLCGNRASSTDIDCLLDPHVAEDADYAAEWKAVVDRAAAAAQYDDDWLNQHLAIFVRRDKRKPLFLESVQQDIVMYRASNLVIYAGRLDWALECKVRRVSYSQERQRTKNVDTTDAAAIIRLMREQQGKPITAEYLRSLNYNGFDLPPSDDAIKNIAAYYREHYGEDGIEE